MSVLQVPSPFMINAQLQDISKRFWAGEATAQEIAFRKAEFVSLAATYNEIMRSERAHRVLYGCKSNWTCTCPVHKILGQDCNRVFTRLESLDFGAPDPGKPFSAQWWSVRGFTLVVPGNDPEFEYVLLDGNIPVSDGILERAARWWVQFMEANLLGKARSAETAFDAYAPLSFDPIDWTEFLRARLQAALVNEMEPLFAKGEPEVALEPLRLSVGPWGHDALFSAASKAIGFEHIGMPRFQQEVKMSITPASIVVEQRV